MFVTDVPADGTCLRITVEGTRTVTRTFDLPAGQSSTVSLPGLPLGSDTFTDEAFAGACSAVTASSIATWRSDPVTAVLQAGVVTDLTLVLHRNGQANVTSDFQDEPGGCAGAACTTASDCCTGTACVSGVCTATTTCPAGQQLCANVCTDTTSSVNNCGACGLACPPVPNGTSLCVSGACTTGGCFPGFADCTPFPGDGCETNILNNPSNCGGCGIVCQGGASCVNGACVATCDPATSVFFGGHCYYLDGSGGTCDPGYQLASQSVLTSIAPLFAGRTYKHAVSSNCCIFNADPVENWGMTAHCNAPGPFSPGEPALGGAGCTNATTLAPAQLTLCGTP